MSKFTFAFVASLLLAASSLAANPPKGFKSERIDAGGVTYNVYSGGEGPAVLLIHGYAETAQMWFPLMEKWKSKYMIIAPDLKGIGPGIEIYNSPSIWHFRFNGPYAERLVKGRERIFFDALWEGFAETNSRYRRCASA